MIHQKTQFKDQIKSAIGAHGLWKGRINTAVETGASEWDPGAVQSSHNCDFGKWLDTFPVAERNGQYKKVADLHADFHKEAASVLKMALSGDKARAKKAVAMGSEYEKLTTSLTRAMMEWRDQEG